MRKNSVTLPSVLYHGTNFAFEKFEDFRLGSSCRNPSTCFGFYFTDSIDDAWSWAKRGSERAGVPNSPRVIEVRLDLTNVLQLSQAKFHFYLQRAKVSTMQRQVKQWQADGLDGFTVAREDCKWYLPFDTFRIEIIGSIDRAQFIDQHAADEGEVTDRHSSAMRP